MPVDFFQGQRQINSWGGRIADYLRSTVFKRTTASCSVLLLYIIAGRKVEDYFGFDLELPVNDVSLFGAALSLLMVLRTNSAYDRWWEGRKLWGALVNNCRNVALKISAMAEVDKKEMDRAQELITTFPKALKEHLRAGASSETYANLSTPCPDYISHVPNYLSGELFRLVRRWRDEGKLNKMDHHLIDQHIVSFMDICGACERIRNTPLPLAHRALIPQLLGLYLLVVPLGLQLTVMNLVVTVGVSYFLLGLEIAAEDIEEPFGHDCNDLPLDLIAGNIERSVNEVFAHHHTLGGTEGHESTSQVESESTRK